MDVKMKQNTIALMKQSAGQNVRRLYRKAATLILILALACSTGNAYAAQDLKLIPVGQTVGIAADIDGAVVVNVVEPKGDENEAEGAEKAGIRAGDILIQIDDTKICCAADVQTAVDACGGQAVTVRLIRGYTQQEVCVTPIASPDGGYELGVWLRDSIYGLGTVTFISPDTGLFCALGHAITDVDTGVLVPLENGQILPANITGIVRGKSGTPGQIQGVFGEGEPLGTFKTNTVFGISGQMNAASNLKPISVETDLKKISVGEAVILTDAAGDGPQEYTIEISRIYSGDDCGGRELMITVTDERLLELTGGIVQGMSGSPIIQNGKLIGAVTHVLVNNPTKGYGISIQKMLDAASSNTNVDIETKNAA